MDCKGEDLSHGMRGQVLQGKYHIGKPVDQGQYGRIFNVEDATGAQKSKYSKLVIKFSEDFESIAHEIKVLKKIDKKFQSESKWSKSGFPPMISYGMFIGSNIDSSDLKIQSQNDE